MNVSWYEFFCSFASCPPKTTTKLFSLLFLPVYAPVKLALVACKMFGLPSSMTVVWKLQSQVTKKKARYRDSTLMIGYFLNMLEAISSIYIIV